MQNWISPSLPCVERHEGFQGVYRRPYCLGGREADEQVRPRHIGPEAGDVLLTCRRIPEPSLFLRLCRCRYGPELPEVLGDGWSLSLLMLRMTGAKHLWCPVLEKICDIASDLPLRPLVTNSLGIYLRSRDPSAGPPVRVPSLQAPLR